MSNSEQLTKMGTNRREARQQEMTLQNLMI